TTTWGTPGAALCSQDHPPAIVGPGAHPASVSWRLGRPAPSGTLGLPSRTMRRLAETLPQRVDRSQPPWPFYQLPFQPTFSWEVELRHPDEDEEEARTRDARQGQQDAEQGHNNAEQILADPHGPTKTKMTVRRE